MKHLQNRIDLMIRLGEYLKSNPEEWQYIVDSAHRANGWFVSEFTTLAVRQIVDQFLDADKLKKWIVQYPAIQSEQIQAKKVGLVMAGNIPLVGFHDFLAVFLSGHQLCIKLSSKDTVLWKYILNLLNSWDSTFFEQVQLLDFLKGCDAYIATGSNNSARYFEEYFAKYPAIIRKNRTSVAILDGTESAADLDNLTDDISLYFGMGCRNITKLFVPKEYNFEPLIQHLKKYVALVDHNKFRNNYDYQLALYLLNQQMYMTDGHVLLVENESNFAPISVVHYEYYEDINVIKERLAGQMDQIQCITTNVDIAGAQSFGHNQSPTLTDYADGVDTMAFLSTL